MLVLHNVQNVKKNKDINSLTEINNIKSQEISINEWSDTIVIKNLNKISIFDESISEYKRKIQSIEYPLECFDFLKDVSKELTLYLY